MPVATSRPAPIQTPWGPSQHVAEVAEGVELIHTASHGGWRISPEALKAWPKLLRELETFAGKGWYEEDCDAAIVILAMPALFNKHALFCAHRMLQRQRPLVCKQFEETPEGKAVVREVDLYLGLMARESRYERGSASTHGGDWVTWWYPFNQDLPTLHIKTKDYPTAELMTHDELMKAGAVAARL